MTVTLNHVSKQFGQTTILDNVTCAVNEGEFITLIGPSGSGKTTLLRVILGDLQPDIGQVYLNDNSMKNVPINQRNIGFVPQNFGLFPHLSVSENIAYGLTIRKQSKQEITNRVNELMHKVNLKGVEAKKPGQLSWGQQQRVALARALAIEPELLLLDEPLSAVDWETRERIAIEIQNLQKQLEITTLYVTHDLREALKLGDRIMVLHNGKIEQFATPQELRTNPKSPFIARLIHRFNER